MTDDHSHDMGSAREAVSIRATYCDQCNNLHVWLMDENDEAFAVAELDEQAAISFLEAIISMHRRPQ